MRFGLSQFPREPRCALPESSRNLTSTPFRGAGALKGYIGHSLKSIGSGDVEGAGLGAQSIAPAEFRGQGERYLNTSLCSRSLLTGVFSLSRRAPGPGRVAMFITCP